MIRKSLQPPHPEVTVEKNPVGEKAACLCAVVPMPWSNWEAVLLELLDSSGRSWQRSSRCICFVLVPNTQLNRMHHISTSR